MNQNKLITAEYAKSVADEVVISGDKNSHISELLTAVDMAANRGEYKIVVSMISAGDVILLSRLGFMIEAYGSTTDKILWDK